MTTVEMSIRMSDEQIALYQRVRDSIKNVPCFECEGDLFIGDKVEAAMRFAYNNPTGGDFFVWLQDNGYTRINNQ